MFFTRFFYLFLTHFCRKNACHYCAKHFGKKINLPNLLKGTALRCVSSGIPVLTAIAFTKDPPPSYVPPPLLFLGALRGELRGLGGGCDVPRGRYFCVSLPPRDRWTRGNSSRCKCSDNARRCKSVRVGMSASVCHVCSGVCIIMRHVCVCVGITGYWRMCGFLQKMTVEYVQFTYTNTYCMPHFKDRDMFFTDRHSICMYKNTIVQECKSIRVRSCRTCNLSYIPSVFF